MATRGPNWSNQIEGAKRQGYLEPIFIKLSVKEHGSRLISPKFIQIRPQGALQRSIETRTLNKRNSSLRFDFALMVMKLTPYHHGSIFRPIIKIIKTQC